MQRFLLTSLAVGIAALFAVAVLYNATVPSRPSPDQGAATDAARPAREGGGPDARPRATAPAQKDRRTAAGGVGEAKEGAAPPRPSGEEPRATRPNPDLVEVGELESEPIGTPAETTLGSTGPDTKFRLEARITRWGAGLMRARLAHYYVTAKRDKPYTILSAIEGEDFRVYPLSARAVHVNGKRVEVQSSEWGRVRRSGSRSVVYGLRIRNRAGEPILRIERHYRIEPGSYQLQCRQRLRNLAGGPIEVAWEQYGQGDVPRDRASYLGDRRMLAAGYFDLAYDPSRRFIDTEGTYVGRSSVLGRFAEDASKERIPWPGPAVPKKAELAWLGTVNRYFAAVIHPPVPGRERVSEMPALSGVFPEQWIPRLGAGENRKLVFGLRTAPRRLEAEERMTVNLALFAGPRLSELFNKQPYAALHFENLVVYELGCTWCTFQPLAHGLLALLEAFHAVVWDWGLAIILLVLLVRLLLHPITRRSQANMMKMQKQMQAMQPEIERLKKKYADDQQKFQQEQMKLFREKGVNPLNMLGCLPMFLQMPIWIALYAMLYYAIELRHEPAFYGVFQMVSGGEWDFLRDLSRPDRFITFAQEPVRLPLPLVSAIDFSSLNLLPILWAVTMFFQQKLMTPEAQSEQQAQQQKIMQYAMLGIPIFLYSAPSGLTLYILASTGAGILDSHLIRKHVQQQEEAGTLFQQKPRKEGGFMDRFQKALEAKQQEMQQMQEKGGGGTPPKKGGGKSGGGRGKHRPKR